MVLSDLLGLFNIAKDLVDKKVALDQSFFTNFIEPSWEVLTTIHKNYEESIARYIAQIRKSDEMPENAINYLLEQLDQDTRATKSLRLEIQNMTNAIMEKIEVSSRPLNPQLFAYIDAVRSYFDIKTAVQIVVDSEQETQTAFKEIPSKTSGNTITNISNITDTVNVYRVPMALYLHLYRRAKKNDKQDVIQMFYRMQDHIQEKYGQVGSAYHFLKAHML